MKIFKFLKTLKDEYQLNPNLGTFSWVIHRITGILLILYIFPHIWSVSSSQAGKESFDAKMNLFGSPFFKVLELGLVLLVAIHMLNGIRITLTDFALLTRKHKLFFWIGVTLFVLALVYSSIKFAPHILKTS